MTKITPAPRMQHVRLVRSVTAEPSASPSAGPAGVQQTVRFLAELATERFLRYARVNTQSDPDSRLQPSTAEQLDLLALLCEELIAIGLADAKTSELGYLVATLPSNVSWEVPTIGLIAHVDTTPEVSGAGVAPRRVRYSGGDITLDSGDQIRVSESPELANHIGHDVITTDGTTLLGADDKAGVAEIMAAIEFLATNSEIPHGPVRLAFTPDEEIVRGAFAFPLESFGASAAYTVDCSTAGEIQVETFSGAEVEVVIEGRSIHPGWAKDNLLNAIKMAAELVVRLPSDTLSPETTEGREGFVHPTSIKGDSRRIELRFCVRDFDDQLLDDHIAYLTDLARQVESLDERGSIRVDVGDRFHNMRDRLEDQPEIVGRLERAIRRVGLTPRKTSLRGGTDGSVLTQRGLPTPNMFAGWQNAHSEREWVCVEDMGLASTALVELARIWAEDCEPATQ